MEENKEDVKEEVSNEEDQEESQDETQSESSTDEVSLEEKVAKLEETNKKLVENLRKQSGERSSITSDDSSEEEVEETDELAEVKAEVEQLKKVVQTSSSQHEKPALAEFYTTEYGKRYSPENDPDNMNWKNLNKAFKAIQEFKGTATSKDDLKQHLKEADAMIRGDYSDIQSEEKKADADKQSASAPGRSVKEETTSTSLSEKEQGWLKFAGGDELVKDNS